MDYTAGKGTTALGIIGTTLGGLAVAGAPILGRAAAASCDGADHFVNRYDAAKDARIAQLETDVKFRDSELFTRDNMIEMYKYLDGELRSIRNELCDQKFSINVPQILSRLLKLILPLLSRTLKQNLILSANADAAPIIQSSITLMPLSIQRWSPKSLLELPRLHKHFTTPLTAAIQIVTVNRPTVWERRPGRLSMSKRRKLW